ncbi:MAG TPA: BMP family ABC transporter substrate-binding protein, partial [Gaiellaceae bacterium]|nr:BMP family ABC transporter substrate-binding protein [Gaiellaceae bacterium]
MKRLIPFVLLTVALAVLAAGCGSKKKAAGSTTAASPTTTVTSSFKVGLSTDTGGLNDRSFNHLAYVGLQRAASELGVQTRVVTSKAPSDYIPNLTALAKQGFNLVIGVGFTEIDAVKTVAQAFPKTHFAIVDVSNADEGNLKNVEGLLFKEQEAGYLAGYAAGLAAQARGGTAVSSVGGQKQPPVDRYIAGYQAGAKAAFPAVKLINGYSQDFSNQAKCKEVALNQIAGGSVVVFQVAGGCGLGALDAAKGTGIWGVGVDADQSYLGTYVLTSALKRVDTNQALQVGSKQLLASATKGVDVSVVDVVGQLVDGKFKGGTDLVLGIS